MGWEFAYERCVHTSKVEHFWVQVFLPGFTEVQLHRTIVYVKSRVVLSYFFCFHFALSEQVALRWLVQKGASFTTSAHSVAHFKENIDIFDFELDASDMATLDKLV